MVASLDLIKTRGQHKKKNEELEEVLEIYKEFILE